MIQRRYIVVESRGNVTNRKTLAESTMRRRITDLRTWADAPRGTFTDAGHVDTLRVIRATRYVNGVESVRMLRIRPASVDTEKTTN